MIYYIKVYSLPRSQAMRFDLKHQSHCLSCIFSQKIQFAFVDCSSICKQCLCIYKGSNTHGIANLPCVFCSLGCNPNPCEHHGTVMAAHSCGVLKERFAETRSLHRHDAEQQVWAVPNKLLQGKGLCIYKDIACKRASAYQNGTTKHCLQKLLHPSELSIPLAAVILGLSKFFREDVAVTAQTMQIGSRPCRIYGEAHAEYLLLQMTGEHELQSMDSEVAAIAQSAHHFLFAAIPVESWNDALSPWEAPAVWGKQGFGGKAADTLCFLTGQVIPTLKQQFRLPENVKIILGGYSLAGLFALWASTQTDLFYGVAAASPSVWFPGWMEFEQQHPIQAQRIYLSLGSKEEHTKSTVMAAVGDNIRTLHSRLTERGADCTLEWNSGGHFKDADLRTARAFRWVMEESR